MESSIIQNYDFKLSWILQRELIDKYLEIISITTGHLQKEFIPIDRIESPKQVCGFKNLMEKANWLYSIYC